MWRELDGICRVANERNGWYRGDTTVVRCVALEPRRGNFRYAKTCRDWRAGDGGRFGR